MLASLVSLLYVSIEIKIMFLSLYCLRPSYMMSIFIRVILVEVMREIILQKISHLLFPIFHLIVYDVSLLYV
jgi:hypothetical protein